jgi:excisionase family DNA binding protein
MSNQKVLIEMGLGDLEETIRKVIREEFTSRATINNKKEEKVITRKQAAGMLGVSLPTLSNLIKEGDIPAYHLGGQIRFIESEVLSSIKLVQTKKYNRGNL